MADWRQLYAATIQEKDAKELDVLMEKTSRAMEARLEDLSRTKANVAANALLSLKVAQRKWEKQPQN
jgi:hypothetical protein